MKFEGKIAVVTGAGSGIGRSTAVLLAKRGAKVHVVDLDAGRAAETATQIEKSGGRAAAHEVDCTRLAAVEALAEKIAQAEGRIDILHNNAGIGHAGAIEEISIADWERVLDINLWGVINGVHAFLPQLLKQGGESWIVNTASGLGLIAAPGLAPYVTSKFAVVGMSESLAAELRPKNIYVSVICPGIINTNIVKDTKMSGRVSAQQETAQKMYARFGATADQVAKDVVRAIEKKRVIQTSPPSQMLGPWMLKRLSPSLYQFFASQFGKRLLKEA